MTTTATSRTAAQAATLNDLAEASRAVVQQAQALAHRCAEIAEQVTAGTHISGFDGNVLGSSAGRLEAAAADRKTLIRVAHRVGVTTTDLELAAKQTTPGGVYFEATGDAK